MPLLQIQSSSPQARVSCSYCIPTAATGQIGTGPLRSTRYEPGFHPLAPNLVEHHPSDTQAEEMVQGPSRTVASLPIFFPQGFFRLEPIVSGRKKYSLDCLISSLFQMFLSNMLLDVE